jgi:hypothetical protein
MEGDSVTTEMVVHYLLGKILNYSCQVGCVTYNPSVLLMHAERNGLYHRIDPK